MALLVTNGATAAIESVNRIKAFPFTVGFWAMPGSVDGAGPWTVRNTSSEFGTAHFSIRNNAGNWDCLAQDDAFTQVSPTAGAFVSGSWSFILLRQVSASFRCISSLDPSGSVTTGADSTALTTFDFSGMNSHCIGEGNGATDDDARIAEFWYTFTDVQPDGATTQDALVRQLAFGGPFSVPHIGTAVQEYKSFRKSVIDNRLEPADSYSPTILPPVWAQAGDTSAIPTICAHPPLPYWFKRPTEDIASIAMI